MTDSKYNEARPSISAELRRAVEVESGHACAVKNCGEHTYLEIHHINTNREDNRVENLILLCDKHHKMAHAGVIDRKALRQYKDLLKSHYGSELHARVARLEALVAQEPKAEDVASLPQPDDGRPQIFIQQRAALMALTLEQLALSRLEYDRKTYFDRGVELLRDGAGLQVDALRQDDVLTADLVIEVKWLRKRYLDAPVWVKKIDEKVGLYEMMTGRKAKGILVFVVPKDSMKSVADLHYTSEELQKSFRQPEVVIYTYGELGFDPGPISAALFTSNALRRFE